MRSRPGASPSASKRGPRPGSGAALGARPRLAAAAPVPPLPWRQDARRDEGSTVIHDPRILDHGSWGDEPVVEPDDDELARLERWWADVAAREMAGGPPSPPLDTPAGTVAAGNSGSPGGATMAGDGRTTAFTDTGGARAGARTAPRRANGRGGRGRARRRQADAATRLRGDELGAWAVGARANAGAP